MTETNNPWTILAEENKYDNAWIKVTEYDVLNPAGGKGIYGKVHFKNHAIGVVPLDENLNTYLVGQFRFPINQYSWEIPEGGCPVGEDHLQAAQRELLEETGLQAAHWQKIADVYLSNSVSDEAGSLYVATALTQHNAAPEETEKLVVKKIPFEEVYAMVVNGEITDMLSVTAILRVKLMLLNGDVEGKYVSVE